MYTIWNPDTKAADLLATIYFGNGSQQYKLPIHLEAGASKMVDIGELAMANLLDVEGHPMPLLPLEGHLVVSGPQGDVPGLINVVVSGGIYNPTLATCGAVCITCGGCNTIGFQVLPNPSTVPTGNVTQVTCACSYSNGSTQTFTSVSSWNSNNTVVANFTSPGTVKGNQVGTATFTANFPNLAINAGQVCSGFSPQCPTANPVATGTGNVNCNFPTGETSQFYTWGDNDPRAGYSAAIAGFYQVLTPAVNYSGIATITEGNASPATDSCWFNGAIQSYGPPPVKATPTYGDNGSTWTVAGGAWGNDYVGLGYTLFSSYQNSLNQRGLTSCAITMFQTLTANCSNGSSKQFDGTVVLNILITGGGISITREGVNAARTLVAH
jgi:hypothetical protein